MIIRVAEKKDVPQSRDIYNHAIRNTSATFATEEKSLEERIRWFEAHSIPILVSQVKDSTQANGSMIAGWAALSAWSERCAYSGTCENSVYVDPKYQGKGVGKQLLSELLELAKQKKIHTIIARVTMGNESSLRLHESAGFQSIGIMKEVGFKFDRFHNVQLMQFLI